MASGASVSSRVAAAVVGGFIAASAVVIALPALAPTGRVDWVTGASMGGFALWTGAAIWAFAARTAGRAWAGLAVVTAVCAAVTWLSGAGPA